MKKGTRIRVRSEKKYGQASGLPRSQNGGRSGVILKPTSKAMEGTWDIKLDNDTVVSIHQRRLILWLHAADASMTVRTPMTPWKRLWNGTEKSSKPLQKQKPSMSSPSSNKKQPNTHSKKPSITSTRKTVA